MNIPDWTNEQIVNKLNDRLERVISPMSMTEDRRLTPYAQFVNRIAQVFVNSFFLSDVGSLLVHLATSGLFNITLVNLIGAAFSLGMIAEREKWFQSSVEWADHRDFGLPLDNIRNS